MTRAARTFQTADFPPSPGRRRAPSPARSTQLAIVFDGEPLKPAAAPAEASPRSSDWAGFREGAREVLVTLMATLAIGLAWAAIEAGRLGAELPSPVAASIRESR